MRTLLVLLALMPSLAVAAPEDAERFTTLAGLHLSDLPSFEDVEKVFGPSRVRESGDAASYDARLCYRTANGNAVVEFFHGEVDWGFTFRRARSGDKHCPKIAASNSSQLNVAGIWLGMDRENYKKNVGQPDKEHSGSLVNNFSYVHVLTDSDVANMVERGKRYGYTDDAEMLRRWDVDITLTARFLQGKLSSFTVDRVETN